MSDENRSLTAANVSNGAGEAESVYELEVTDTGRSSRGTPLQTPTTVGTDLPEDVTFDVAYTLLSGGPDSTAVARWAQERRPEQIRGIYAYHGEQSGEGDLELRRVEELAEELDVPLRVLDLRPLWESIGVAAGSIPTTRDGGTDPLWSIQLVSNYAARAGAEKLYLGLHRDLDDLPRVRRVLECYQAAIDHAGPTRDGESPAGVAADGFRIEYPLVEKTKAELVAIGAEHDAPMSGTWSCEEHGDVHCGECRGCERRRRAFEAAGIEDRTEYLTDWDPPE